MQMQMKIISMINNFCTQYNNISMKVLPTLILTALVYSTRQQDPGEDDIVSNVPGYSDSSIRVFANYLNSKSSNSSLHYILIESKAGKGNNDPLTVWYNGGPGCSSKIGFLQQIGPFYLPANSPYNSTVMLTQNNHSWHTLSNLLFIDAPPGVGHSVPGDASYIYNDQNTAQDNLNALVDFFINKFPSYKTKNVFLAGQSYAGKFIPDLALRINAYNVNGDFKINIKGILVGNGIMDMTDDELQQSEVNYMFSHNFVDPTLDKYWDTSCKTDPASAGCNFFFKRYNDIHSLVNFQNIYGACYGKFPNMNDRKSINAGVRNSKAEFYNLYKKCQYYEGIEQYFQLNSGDFRAKNRQFTACNEAIYENYEITPSGSMNEYSRLITETTIRIHLFAGDWDDVVPFTNTIKNIQKMGLRQNGAIKPWIGQNKQHVGFKRSYIRGQKQIRFWIIKGAGHEVPQHKREVALELFKSFINNLDV